MLDITTLYVAAPELLEQYGPIDQPEDLLNLPLVYGSVDHWLLKRGDEQRMVPVAGKGTRMVSGRVMRNAAVAGLGATRVGDVYVQSDIRDGRLIQILPEWSETTSLSLVCPPLRHQLARVRALMDWLKARAPQAYAELLASR